LGFIGVATPNFLLALVLIWIFHQCFGIGIGGLFSPEFYNQPWSIAKFLDFINHLWVPIIVVGTAGTAWLIRIMRGTLMDELRQQYVMTARAKGVSERRLLYKYPVRIALVPIISVIGWQLPEMISATVITSVVLSLPTIGPIFLKALSGQDMFLAGSIVLILSSLTVVGNFVSDILLVIVDPRIHFESN
jgi:peptide/nickel transport system permease protein